MTAAALLRRLLDATGPRPFSDLTGDERWERVKAWDATRNLLPLLAGLVEAAVAFDAADAAVRAKQDEADLDLLRRCEPEWFANRDALKSAIAALEAAAAKEVSRE